MADNMVFGVAVVHFAAESHVDRSILDPGPFLKTNVLGTQVLLDAARAEKVKRFIHVSTDEVYGSISGRRRSSEKDPLFPNSPYAASKAASDHLVRAWHHTYGLPVLTTNCSNNYGPYQFPEKLMPLMLHQALTEKPLPVYGDGQNVRDWLHVSDHASGIRRVLEAGRVGETYNIGGNSELANLTVVKALCDALDRHRPSALGTRRRLIQFVTDRPGHDRRYAIDASKIRQELNWQPAHTFDSGLEQTVHWYLTHQEWSERVLSGAYRSWLEQNYAERRQEA